jgi:hypothetical protein
VAVKEVVKVTAPFVGMVIFGALVGYFIGMAFFGEHIARVEKARRELHAQSPEIHHKDGIQCELCNK